MERRCDVSAFILGRSMCRPSKIDDRCVDRRRSMYMCRLSKIDVSTFGDRRVDLRRSMVDVSTFEDRIGAPVARIAKKWSYFNEIHCKPQVTLGINYILRYKLNISKHQSYGNSL